MEHGAMIPSMLPSQLGGLSIGPDLCPNMVLADRSTDAVDVPFVP